MYDLEFVILKTALKQNSIIYTDLLNNVCSLKRHRKYDAISVRYSIQNLCRKKLLRSSSLDPSGFDTITVPLEGFLAVMDETETIRKIKTSFWKDKFVNFVGGFLSGILVGIVTANLLS